ncbi:tRNA (adenosine(37)-N6)-threonylcarbamoyltransferase complex ATPase subunit type 1 TsaE [Candidatus Azobacteroides pseudotrichonymphae]|uniref:tRNA threonylcarbamoyladenosine biosynthesis protein TsaE n=1 Tax=Azobacteroides pseudotrichonymphae genomovar. CFP2 TaxID=511995 RepID=B6YRZ9_AZOPC|nr:tRNA (adenosine(37)-N6)-threonylcarbamoyltransferase complex ATPase subunit type 1 TsaE [Candidatus Azobacteroides pseudotrichonymphae]BAG83971.1 conserved hypothetical protein [Candidatus Azobacteroides pseudotrichonymphae genomovar. CFP2]
MELRLEELPVVAKKFISCMGDNKVFAFIGEIGVGKTTFIKKICDALGVKDMVNSPTFSIVNEYYAEFLNSRIYHFDFYRIESIEEAINIGIEDYFESGVLCFMEWADRIGSLLPKETIFVNIGEQLDGLRSISWSM